MVQVVLAGKEAMLGRDQLETLKTVTDMAAVYENNGDEDTAIQMYERALVGTELISGKYHLQTLRICYSMGYLSHFLSRCLYEL